MSDYRNPLTPSHTFYGISSPYRNPLTPSHTFYDISSPFRPEDYVTESYEGKENPGVQERPHSGLFEQMQAMVHKLGQANNPKEVDK